MKQAVEDTPIQIEIDETQDQSPSSKQGDTATFDPLLEVHFGRMLNWFGIDNFICSNPTPLKAFDASKLEGAWFQAHASRSTDVYGCIQYQFVNNPDASDGDLKAINLNASWTAFNTYWNPFEKGQYAKQYELDADTNGRLFDRQIFTRENTFSYITETDYTSYFVQYACKQSLFDFWTIEYYDVYTKDGS